MEVYDSSFPLELCNKNHQKNRISCLENKTEKMTGVHSNGGGRWFSGKGIQNSKQSRSIERSCDGEQDLVLIFLEQT